MGRRVVVACAVTGAIRTLSMSPHLPSLPIEIADAAIGAVKSVAAITHLHARDLQDGRPSQDPEHVAPGLSLLKDRTDARRLNTDLSSDGGDHVAQQRLAAGPHPDAIVVRSDVVASGLIATLPAAGVSGPGDVAVIGVDEIYPESSMSGELTTVEVPRREMASAAVQQLIQRIDGVGGPPRRLILAHRFRAGTVCGCSPPPAAKSARASRRRKDSA